MRRERRCGRKQSNERRTNYKHASEDAFSTHDLCLVRTKYQILFNKWVNRVALQWKAYDIGFPFDRTELLIAGFGDTSRDKNVASMKLLLTKQKYINYTTCVKSTYNILIDEEIFCTTSHDENNKISATCSGDSGGGIIYIDSITNCATLIGVAKLSNCIDRSVYTWIYVYRSYILETMERFTHPKKKKIRIPG